MGKGCKVVVCGLLSVGKTAILEQLLYGNHTIGKMIFLCFSRFWNWFRALVGHAKWCERRISRGKKTGFCCNSTVLATGYITGQKTNGR